MQRIELDLDVGGMKPIVDAFMNHDYNQNFEIVLNHRPNRRVRVEKYPLLCSIVNEIKKLGNTCNIVFNCEHNCSQLNYAERMGFLSFMEINYNYPLTRRAGGGRFIELRNITNIFYPENELLNVFQKDFNFTEEEAYDVATIISELVNNSHMHSENNGGSIFYCQKYPAQNYLNLYIVDSGVGVFRAMQIIEKYKGLDELEVLKKSLEFGEGNGRGYGQGLFLVTQFIKRNLGYLRLVTGNYQYFIKNGNEMFTDIGTNYKGVILNLGLPFDTKITIQDIMNEKMN